MKYNVGDKVRIKSIDWYNENKDEDGRVACGYHIFTKDMSKFCGCTMIVCNRTNLGVMNMGGSASYWTDEMIEGLVEEEVFIKANDIYNEEYSKGEYCHEQSFKWGFQEGYNYSHDNDKLEISLKEDYQFVDENGNVINATKIVLEKKKEYPKTFEECVHVLEGENRMSLEQMNTFRKLIDARNAYWKIAGEKMGLGEPWEPDWTDEHQVKYTIYTMGNDVIRHIGNYIHAILSFPTEEMRDAFYENFKVEIESCKELL